MDSFYNGLKPSYMAGPSVLLLKIIIPRGQRSSVVFHKGLYWDLCYLCCLLMIFLISLSVAFSRSYNKIFHNLTPWDPSEVFTLSIPLYNLHSVSHSFNIRKPLCRIKIYENHFFNRCISAWNSLPSYVVESKSLTLFKRNLKIIDLSAFLKYVF